MISHIDIIRPEFCTRYRYTSDNSFDKHFYISFAAHIEGNLKHHLSLWDWLLGRPSKEHVDQHVYLAYYKQRSHWHRLGGELASVDEEVALNAVKDRFDRELGFKGGPKFTDKTKGFRAFWPKKRVGADLRLA